MRLRRFSLKIPEVLLEEIQREAETKQISGAELIRQRMDASGSQIAAQSQLIAKVDRLGQQLSLIKEEIAKLAAQQESLTPLIAATHSINENLSRLVELLNEEKKFPFGMNRNFVQVATMASFTLARGTFSNAPEAWEPYKEEARRRAFKAEGGDQ